MCTQDVWRGKEGDQARKIGLVPWEICCLGSHATLGAMLRSYCAGSD